MSLKYEGAAWFRQRLVLSTLSSRPVLIRNIRSLDEQPGLKGPSHAVSTLTIFNHLKKKFEQFRVCLGAPGPQVPLEHALLTPDPSPAFPSSRSLFYPTLDP